MEELTSWDMHMCFGGSYYENVTEHAAVDGFWLLNEMQAATGARDSVGLNDGTYAGTVTLGQTSPFPHGGTSCLLDGSSGNVTIGDVAAFEYASAFAVECMFKTTAASAAIGGLVTKALGTPGWHVLMTAAGEIRFAAFTAASATVFDITTPDQYDDGVWHHLVCTWSGTTSADRVKIYVDSIQVQQGTASAGTIAANAALLVFGGRDNGAGVVGTFFNGTLAGVALYSDDVVTSEVVSHYNSTVWTEVTDDVGGGSLNIDYGISGLRPLDRVASSGTLDFTLINSSANSGGLDGYYSPNHANLRTGFDFDVPVRVQLTYDGTTTTRFWGRISLIDPTPGQYLEQATRVVAHDYAYLIGDTDLREVTAQLNKTEVELLYTIIEALPWNVQPIAIDFDDAEDTFPYAFYDLKGGVKAVTAISKVVISSFGKFWVNGDGTLRYRARTAGQLDMVAFNLDDQDLNRLENISDRSNRFDIVRATVHPKSVDAAATTVLYSHPDTILVAAAGGVETIWVEYRNPTDDFNTTVGGTDMVQPVANTDYVANSGVDGSGTDLTADVTIVATYFASTAKLEITNDHATLSAYVGINGATRLLQIRGKGIYDLTPVTLESRDANATRPLDIDLPYQDDAAVGQEISDRVLDERSDVPQQVAAVGVPCHRNAETMSMAATCEPGDIIAVTETQTGLLDAQVFAQRISLSLAASLHVKLSVSVVPVTIGNAWLLGVVGRGEIGEETILGT